MCYNEIFMIQLLVKKINKILLFHQIAQLLLNVFIHIILVTIQLQDLPTGFYWVIVININNETFCLLCGPFLHHEHHADCTLQFAFQHPVKLFTRYCNLFDCYHFGSNLIVAYNVQGHETPYFNTVSQHSFEKC